MLRAPSFVQRSLRLALTGNLHDSGFFYANIELGVYHLINNYATMAPDIQHKHLTFGGIAHDQTKRQQQSRIKTLEHDVQDTDNCSKSGVQQQKRTGDNISSRDKQKFLTNTLLDLKESKEAVYGTLDAWVAWEQSFPLVSLKRALLFLEKGQQWHRIVQVIKWMLSKGQGITMGTYEQLIRGLEKDNRAEEAHQIWVKKIGYDLHSVPWRVCELMISIYYRNNMLERLVKLFKDLEAYDRKPPDNYKSLVRKVVDAYEMLGLHEDKNRILERYDTLLSETPREFSKKSKKIARSSTKAGRNSRKGWRNSVPSTDQMVSGSSSDDELEATA